jgi:osmotically-inducible protein OsmY
VHSNPLSSLNKRVTASLHARGYASLNRILCDADGDHVVLRGDLGSFFLKQLAQDVAMKVPGVAKVTNHIEVV